MSAEINPAWRYCGSQIKLWRTEAGVDRATLAKEAGYDYEYIKSMENGRRRPTLRLLQTADQLCGAKGKLVAAQEFLKPEPFPERSQEFMQISKEAISFRSYEPLLIPGMMQTRDYARVLISASSPPLDEETVEERVAARLERQDMLTRRTRVVFGFVIYEAALRTQLGGAEVMRDQLQHVLKLGELRNVSVQVLPTGRECGVALGGPIVLLVTPDHERYAYVEAPQTGVLYAESAKVDALTERHDMIRTYALSVVESAEFIGKVAEEL